MALAPGPGAFAQETSPPDVVLFVIDDLASFQGRAEVTELSTPNLDALAARGARFDRAYCQSPICNPSRASTFSGLRPETTGVFDNRTDWIQRLPRGHLSLAEFFRSKGYLTVRAGKIHHRMGKTTLPEDSTERLEAMWDRVLDPDERARPGRTKGKRPSRARPEEIGPNHYLTRSLAWGVSSLTAEELRDGRNAARIAELLAEPPDQPLYLAFGLVGCHYPLLAPEEFVRAYRPERVRLPEVPEDDLEDVPHEYLPLNRLQSRWLTKDEQRELRATYFACISYVDHCIGIVLDALERSGRGDNTIIALWSDHGMHFGEHSLDRKFTLFEESARVPLILAGPGVPSEVQCERPVELLDLYPTLVALAGLEAPPALEGTSLLPLLEDPRASLKPAAFTARSPVERSLRTERWRYTEWGGKRRAELYDHACDPGEFTNLARNAEHAETLRELRALFPARAKPAR